LTLEVMGRLHQGQRIQADVLIAHLVTSDRGFRRLLTRSQYTLLVAAA
jgi:hypothetical protein